MKRIILLGMTIIITIGLAVSLATPAGAITWGQADTTHKNVGAVLIEVPMPDGTSQLQVFGSGTLIAPTVVLTAGHVTAYLNYLLYMDQITKVYVSFDADLISSTRTLLPVDSCITHPLFNGFRGPSGRSDPYDVGILILPDEVVGITPAVLPLPEVGVLDNLLNEGALRQGKNVAKFTVVGYGSALNWPPPEITYGSQRQSAESGFQALLPAWLRLSQNQKTGNGGTGYGDSGGPVFCTIGGQEVLVAVTSWGDKNTISMGFYYRIDTAEARSFIDPYLQ